MRNDSSALTRMSDRELLTEVVRLAEGERHARGRLISSLAELDARRLYLGEGCSSLFVYCTRILHLSESAAYGRITAARAASRFPVVLELLADGSITLTTITLLSAHLTPDNHLALLAAARYKSKREVDEQVAALHPRLPVSSTVRKLPSPKPRHLSTGRVAEADPPVTSTTLREVEVSPTRRTAIVAPLAPERYKIQFTIGRETYEKLRRVQDLLRHAVPNGDPAAIFDRAVTMLLDDLTRTRLAATDRPRAARSASHGSRHIPAAVRRAVWARDGGRCRFVGTHGRWGETGFLEFHHVVPFAAGGEATVENVDLRCAAHNLHEAEQYFGSLFVRESIGPWMIETLSGQSL